MPNETKPIRISRERKELLAKYATAAVTLYGIISISEFVEVFNNYEADKSNEQEVHLALSRLAKTDDVEYSIKDEIISGPEFQPCFSTYKSDIAAFRKMQRNKPRYLPDKEEFLKYTDCDYREPEKPYTDLKAHILKNKLQQRGEGIDGVDGDLMDLHEMIQSGCIGLTDELDYFTKRQYTFNDMNAINEFLRYLSNAHNNTRMFCNNGYTPNELCDMSGRQRPDFFTEDINNLKHNTRKIGVNETCPCGSGKKYKKCCMNRF